MIPEETMDVKITIAFVLNTIKYTESATEPLFARNNEEATVDKVAIWSMGAGEGGE